MVKAFKVTYVRSDDADETVEADNYVDRGDWIEFVREQDEAAGSGITKVLRVRSRDVKRIDVVEDESS